MHLLWWDKKVLSSNETTRDILWRNLQGKRTLLAPKVHGGIQCPGLKMVAEQLIVQLQAVAAGVSSCYPLQAFIVSEVLAAVTNFCLLCFRNLVLRPSKWFYEGHNKILANCCPAWIKVAFCCLQLRTLTLVNWLRSVVWQMLFCFHCLHSSCLCPPGNSTSDPEKEEWACRECDHSWDVSQKNTGEREYHILYLVTWREYRINGTECCGIAILFLCFYLYSGYIVITQGT